MRVYTSGPPFSRVEGLSSIVVKGVQAQATMLRSVAGLRAGSTNAHYLRVNPATTQRIFPHESCVEKTSEWVANVIRWERCLVTGSASGEAGQERPECTQANTACHDIEETP